MVYATCIAGNCGTKLFIQYGYTSVLSIVLAGNLLPENLVGGYDAQGEKNNLQGGINDIQAITHKLKGVLFLTAQMGFP